MAALSVETGELRSFARNIDLAADTTGFGANACAAESAADIVRDYLKLDSGQTGPIYVDVVRKTEGMQSDVLGVLEALGKALSGSATELHRTADSYDADDDAGAIELDAAYTDGHEGEASTSRWSQAAYMGVPSSVLDVSGPSVPTEQREFVDYVAEILTTDWLSPSDAVNQLISFFFSYDPVEEVSKRFSGDWNSLYLAASAMDNIGGYFAAISAYVPTASSQGINHWTGNAADAALRYFTTLGRSAAVWDDNLTSPADTFRMIAESMKVWAASIGDGLTTVMDAFLAAIIAAAGGTALLETVIGAVIGYLIALGALGTVIYWTYKIWELLDEVTNAIVNLGAILASFTQLALPDGVNFAAPYAYDNELVD